MWYITQYFGVVKNVLNLDELLLYAWIAGWNIQPCSYQYILTTLRNDMKEIHIAKYNMRGDVVMQCD